MDITRRSAIIGTTAAIATAAAIGTSIAAPARIMESPLFPVTSLPEAFMIRVGYDDLRIFITRHARPSLESDRGLQVGSIEEAEDRIIARHGGVYSTYSLSPPELIPVTINRYSNLTVARTRRGPATGVLVHPKLAAYMATAQTSAYQPITDGRAVGRWTHVGNLYGSMAVYAGSHMAEDEIVTFFNGTRQPASVSDALCVDGPGIVFNHNGKLTLMLASVETYASGSAADYISHFRLA